MTDTFKEIGSLFGREGAGAGFAKQTDKESFTYAFAWPEGDTWATLTGYLNLDEQPEEYVRRVLQDGGFFTCPPNRAIFATEEMAKAGYLSQLDFRLHRENRAKIHRPSSSDFRRKTLAYRLFGFSCRRESDQK